MLALKENGAKELAGRYIRPEGPNLVVNGEFTIEEYEQVGITLNKGERFIGFWVGDWANAVLAEHGVGAMTDLAPHVGYVPETLHTYAATSRAYGGEIRISLVEKYPTLSYKHFRIATFTPDRIRLLEMAGREGMTTNDFYGYLHPESKRGTTLPYWRTLDDTRAQFERSYNIMRANPEGILENKPKAQKLLKQAKQLVEFLEENLS